LFPSLARGLGEQREERRRTLDLRCSEVAGLVNNTGKPALVWCQMNDEGDTLEKMIPDAVQVSGRDTDDSKEEKLEAFATGKARILITKPKIGAWGLNFQHCNHVTFFPSHSYEQYYQGVRRCWRFGQNLPVHVDVVTTKGEIDVLKNLQRKQKKADAMFASLIEHMNNALGIHRVNTHTNTMSLPSWM
jgi:superfamily II DNA/RNA helicase